MRHFAITDWADYVRGLVDGGRQRAMQSHLDASCAKCEAIVTALSRVAAVATERDSPPPAVTRSVQGFFAVERPAGHRRHQPLPLR